MAATQITEHEAYPTHTTPGGGNPSIAKCAQGWAPVVRPAVSEDDAAPSATPIARVGSSASWSGKRVERHETPTFAGVY